MFQTHHQIFLHHSIALDIDLTQRSMYPNRVNLAGLWFEHGIRLEVFEKEMKEVVKLDKTILDNLLRRDVADEKQNFILENLLSKSKRYQSWKTKLSSIKFTLPHKIVFLACQKSIRGLQNWCISYTVYVLFETSGLILIVYFCILRLIIFRSENTSVAMFQERNFMWRRAFKGCSSSKFVSPSCMVGFGPRDATAIFGLLAKTLSLFQISND